MKHRNDVFYYRQLVAKLKESQDGCWIWTKAKNKDGYGATCYKGKQIGVHVLMLQLLGVYSKNLVVDHVCKNRLCCNPKHLRMVTARENILKNSNGPAAKNKIKTHCKWGHPFSGENLSLTAKGVRRCKACGRAKAAKRRAKQGKSIFQLDPSLQQIQLFS